MKTLSRIRSRRRCRGPIVCTMTTGLYGGGGLTWA